MRLRSFTALATALPLALAGLNVAAASDDAVFLFAQCDYVIASTGSAALTQDDPGALQSGNSCGFVAPVGSNELGQKLIHWSGTFDGAIETVELRNHIIFGTAAHGQLAGQVVENDLPVTLVIDGDTVFDGVLSDLGRIQETQISVEFDYFMDLTDAEIGDGEHTIEVSFGHASADASPLGSSGVYAWGSSDSVPGGLLINGGEATDNA